MTARDRDRMLWLIDFVNDAMGASGEDRFYRRGRSAVAMLRRQLEADDRARAKRDPEADHRRRRAVAIEDIVAGRDPMARSRR